MRMPLTLACYLVSGSMAENPRLFLKLITGTDIRALLPGVMAQSSAEPGHSSQDAHTHEDWMRAYCEALKVPEDQRTVGMQKIIEQVFSLAHSSLSRLPFACVK